MGLSPGHCVVCISKDATGFEPPTSSLGSSLHGDVNEATKELTTGQIPSCPKCCPSQQVWLHEDDTGITPVATISVMLEEFLQSADVSRSLKLSVVLTDEITTVRLDSLALPNGFVYARTRDVVA
jgi:hypothetical protein